MSAPELQTVLTQLESKMQAELSEGHPYEALQYVQSYVARKKKALGQSTTSVVVFHGATQLISSNASSSAGTLLKWFIEDGAGVDNSFLMCSEDLNSTNYCDIQRVIDLLTPLSATQAFPIVDTIYDPLHLLVAKSKTKSAAITARLNKFEALSAKICAASGDFFPSFKSYVRLGQIKEASEVLLQWSSKGYPSEKAMFFARALLFLLSEGKVAAASELLQLSAAHVQDNISADATPAVGGGADSAPLAVWHLATILTELAVMTPMPRVDKTKLFGHLYGRYGPFLVQLDTKLLELLTKAGEAVFAFNLQQQQQGRSGAAPPPNPMAMLQGLLGGGGGGNGAGGAQQGAGGAGAMDMDKMMNMMSKMKGGR